MLIEKYTANWINHFTAIQQVLQNELQGLSIAIEHVGSTAVPNLDSKPIIDIDIIYYKREDFEKIQAGLLQLGYYHNGNQGIEDREVFKRNGKQIQDVLDTIKHHLYVCAAGSSALERLKYQQMKYELAEKANQNQKVYAALKELNVNTFIDGIIAEEKSSY
jgi:GrpB-like predicted nucleotidyltransferase (UPF0157 family)